MQDEEVFCATFWLTLALEKDNAQFSGAQFRRRVVLGLKNGQPRLPKNTCFCLRPLNLGRISVSLGVHNGSNHWNIHWRLAYLVVVATFSQKGKLFYSRVCYTFHGKEETFLSGITRRGRWVLKSLLSFLNFQDRCILILRKMPDTMGYLWFSLELPRTFVEDDFVCGVIWYEDEREKVNTTRMSASGLFFNYIIEGQFLRHKTCSGLCTKAVWWSFLLTVGLLAKSVFAATHCTVTGQEMSIKRVVKGGKASITQPDFSCLLIMINTLLIGRQLTS